jgi:hypothetical protein
VGSFPYLLAFDGTNMWVTDSGSDAVTKLSPTGATLGTFAVGNQPTGIAFDGTDMWVPSTGVRAPAECVSRGHFVAGWSMRIVLAPQRHARRRCGERRRGTGGDPPGRPPSRGDGPRRAARVQGRVERRAHADKVDGEGASSRDRPLRRASRHRQTRHEARRGLSRACWESSPGAKGFLRAPWRGRVRARAARLRRSL